MTVSKYLILVIIGLGTFSYAQEKINIVERLNIKEDIVALEKRIDELVKKDPKLKNIQGIKQFHILVLGYKDYTTESDINKKKYIDYSFLDLLTPRYDYYTTPYCLIFRKEKKYIETITLITNSSGNLIAMGDGRFINSNFNPNMYFNLTKTLFSKKLDSVIYLESPHTFKYSIGIKDNNLYALEDDMYDLKIYTWEDFMNCCFDDCFF